MITIDYLIYYKIKEYININQTIKNEFCNKYENDLKYLSIALYVIYLYLA